MRVQFVSNVVVTIKIYDRCAVAVSVNNLWHEFVPVLAAHLLMKTKIGNLFISYLFESMFLHTTHSCKHLKIKADYNKNKPYNKYEI